MENPMKRALAVVFSMFLWGSYLCAEQRTDIEYGRAGEVSLKLDVSIPDNGPGPFPVAIIVHGGGWSGGDKQQDITPLFKPLTDAGYVWFSINYRLAPTHRWPACFEDVQTAIRWVKAHAADYHGDPQRIAIFGHSAGGHLAFLAVEQDDPSTRVQAVVGLAPVTDFEQDLEQRGGLSPSLQALLDRPKQVTDESRQILKRIGAINHIQPGLPPFLLIQGSADRTVQPIQSQHFVEKLKAAHVPADLIMINGAQHRVTQWNDFDPTWTKQMVVWLDKMLKPPVPSTRPAQRP
jgi:alpha-L-fucosidase 2